MAALQEEKAALEKAMAAMLEEKTALEQEKAALIRECSSAQAAGAQAAVELAVEALEKEKAALLLLMHEKEEAARAAAEEKEALLRRTLTMEEEKKEAVSAMEDKLQARIAQLQTAADQAQDDLVVQIQLANFRAEGLNTECSELQAKGLGFRV
jgi:hypothetical protein